MAGSADINLEVVTIPTSYYVPVGTNFNGPATANRTTSNGLTQFQVTRSYRDENGYGIFEVALSGPSSLVAGQTFTVGAATPSVSATTTFRGLGTNRGGIRWAAQSGQISVQSISGDSALLQVNNLVLRRTTIVSGTTVFIDSNDILTFNGTIQANLPTSSSSGSGGSS